MRRRNDIININKISDGAVVGSSIIENIDKLNPVDSFYKIVKGLVG